MLEFDSRLRELRIEPVLEGFGPATSAEIIELERKLRRALPPDYSHFLANYGYATFDELVSTPLGDGREAPVAIFFGGGDSGEPIIDVFDTFDDGLQAGILPFARDWFNNLFLLDVRGSEQGMVSYATFEDEGVTAVPVANSFEDFLMGLTVETYDD